MATFHVSGPTPEKAEPYFKALADMPGNTDGRLTLAEYYLRVGKVDEGKKTLLAAAAEKATYAPATRRLAAWPIRKAARPTRTSRPRRSWPRTPRTPTRW